MACARLGETLLEALSYPHSLLKMYSTKLVNKSMVPGNAYITVGDPYNDPKPNPFRQSKKGEKEPTPFRTKVASRLLW